MATTAAKSLQLCPTLRDPIDGSPPASPVPGILQVRTRKWVAISFSNACKWKVKVKSLSRVWLLATPWTAAHQAPPSMGFSRQEYWSGVPLDFIKCKQLVWGTLGRPWVVESVRPKYKSQSQYSQSDLQFSSVQLLSCIRFFANSIWVNPRVYSNSCPLSQWCHPTISSSVIPFSSCLQSFPASGAFPTSQFFASGGQSIGASASASVLPMNIQDWFPLGWTGWIFLQSKGFSRVFSTPQFKCNNSSWVILSYIFTSGSLRNSFLVQRLLS